MSTTREKDWHLAFQSKIILKHAFRRCVAIHNWQNFKEKVVVLIAINYSVFPLTGGKLSSLISCLTARLLQIALCDYSKTTLIASTRLSDAQCLSMLNALPHKKLD